MMTAAKLRATQITKSTTLVSGTDLVVNSGTARMGAETYGAPGGSPQSLHNVLAVPYAEDIAQEMCLPVDLVLKFLRSAGIVAQRRMLDGKPCGIPYVGVLAIRDVTLSATTLALRAAKLQDDIATLEARKAAGYTGSSKLTVDKRIAGKRTSLGKLRAIQRSAYLHMTQLMGDIFRQNAAYLAPVQHFYDQVRAQDGYIRKGSRRLTAADRAILSAIGEAPPTPPVIHVPPVRIHVEHVKRTLAARRRRPA